MSDMGAGVLMMKDSHVREQEEHLSHVIHGVMAKRGYYSRPLQADLVSAVQAEVDRLVAEAELSTIDNVYELSPTKQFKDWKPQDAVAFFERLKAYEAQLQQQPKDKEG